jgi:hypothetical protein
MIRAGKASLEADLAPIFRRLGLDRSALESTVTKLFEPGLALRLAYFIRGSLVRR